MKTPWTPGPWHVYEERGIEVGIDERNICELWRRNNSKLEMADAWLISLSPEMAEAITSWCNANPLGVNSYSSDKRLHSIARRLREIGGEHDEK